MMRILSMVLAPFAGLGAVVGGMNVAVSKGWIGSETAFWLTPSLIALVLLIFTVMVVMRRAYVLAWPLGVGFLTQTVGLLMLLLSDDIILKHWTILWWTLGAMGTVILVMLIVYAVSTIRARLLERELAQGAGGDEEDAERIRTDMLEALEMLRRAGRGRNAIYELPWYLVMGRPAAGKTVAIKNSELGLPVKRDWVKGVGGTYTADWFFTNEMIFLDTPGKWVTEGANQDGQTHWRELVRLLSKYRGRQPLDGLIIVVPADDLLTLSEQELEDQAANIREVVDLIHAELNFRFPIYMLISKSDLVNGFVDFAKLLPAKRRPEIFGWSNSDPNEHDVEELIGKGFKHLNSHIGRYRIEMLAKVARRSVARRLFFFSEELKALQAPFLTFAEAFFSGDRYSDSPVFRGFYFTSGTQEGAPMSKAMAELSQTLGVSAAGSSDAGEPENKRSYFLLDLFRELMVGDEGLVGRTAGHRWKLRRNTFLGAFAPAGIALLFLLLSTIAFFNNKRTYGNIEENASDISISLAKAYKPGASFEESIEASLEQTSELAKYHGKMVSGNPFRKLGMQHPGELAPETFALFDAEFRRTVLEPTLTAASERAMNDMGEGTNVSCLDRIEVLASVVWLRGARRAGWEDMDGLDQVWGLSKLGADGAENVRESLLGQYAHLLKYSDGDKLPGFDVGEVAASIARDCADQGALSTLALYRDFQKECRDLVYEAEAVEDCWDRLQTVLNNASKDYVAFGARFKSLQEHLDKLYLDGGVGEAKVALDELTGITVTTEGKSTQCLEDFDDIAKSVGEFVIRVDLIDDCKEEFKKAGRSQKKLKEVIKRHRAELEPDQAKLGSRFESFSDLCGTSVPDFETLDVSVVENVATGYRRLRCIDPGGRPYRPKVVVAPVPVPRKPAASQRAASSSSSSPSVARQAKKAKSSAAPRSGSSSSYQWFEAPASVGKYYRLEKWPQQEETWLEELDATEDGFAQEKEAVGGKISGYAKNFTNEWMEYVESLELKSESGPIENWLQELATTDEYERLLGPALEAASIKPEGPLEFVAPKLRPLQKLGELDIGEYQGTLDVLAEDIEKCRSDPQAFQDFKAAYKDSNRNNSLIEAQKWVTDNAGNSVLRNLFEKPLTGAKEFVHGDQGLKGQWERLHDHYNENISGRPPFGGDMASDEAASFESIRVLLGGETGAVAQVLLAAGDQPLNRKTKEWMDKAKTWSALFFKKGTDDPRVVGFTLELVPIDSPDKKQKKDLKGLQVQAVEIKFSDDIRCELDLTDKKKQEALARLDDKNSCVVKLKLIGDEASEKSMLAGVVAEKKGLVGGLVGGNFKDGVRRDGVLKGQPDTPAVAEGVLAPVKLLDLGWTDKHTVEFELMVPISKKKVVPIPLNFDISGADAELLYDLLQEGLPAPPPGIKAD